MAMTKNNGQEKITALYCRLSVEDIKEGADKDRDSNSVKNQKQILSDYAATHGYHNTRFFVDATCIIGTNQSPSRWAAICPYFSCFQSIWRRHTR